MCFLAKISLHRPTCKTTFVRLTRSQAISQSFRVFISFRSMRDTTFFHFSKLFFIQNYRFLYHCDQKISYWTSCRWRAAYGQLRNPPVKFRHERWLHLAIDRSISIQYVKLEPDVNSDLGSDSFCSFGSNSMTLRMYHIDLLTCRCTCRSTSTQVKICTGLIASTDLWPQEMFTFLEILALVESESCFGAYVCHRRPAGLPATSDLVPILRASTTRPRYQLTEDLMVEAVNLLLTGSIFCVLLREIKGLCQRRKLKRKR